MSLSDFWSFGNRWADSGSEICAYLSWFLIHEVAVVLELLGSKTVDSRLPKLALCRVLVESLLVLNSLILLVLLVDTLITWHLEMMVGRSWFMLLVSKNIDEFLGGSSRVFSRAF